MFQGGGPANVRLPVLCELTWRYNPKSSQDPKRSTVERASDKYIRQFLNGTWERPWYRPPPRWRSGGIHCTKCVWKSSSQALHSSMDLIVLLWLGGTVGERSPPPTRSKKYGVSVWCKEKIWSYFLQFPVCRLTVSQSTNFLSSGEWYISPFFCR